MPCEASPLASWVKPNKFPVFSEVILWMEENDEILHQIQLGTVGIPIKH